MNTRSSIKTSSVIAYTILAVTFFALAFWLFAPTPLSPRLTNLKKFVGFSFFIVGFLYALTLINTLLRKIHEVKRLPGILGSFYDRNFFTNIRSFLSLAREKSQNLKTALLLWGVVILALTVILSFTGVLDNRELTLFQFLGSRVPFSGSISGPSSSPIVQLSIYSGDNNTEKYLKVCLEIVSGLKRLGAKAVLVDARAPMLSRPQNIETFRRINDLGVAVFGFSRDMEWILQNFDRQAISVPAGFYTMEDVDWPFVMLARFYPTVSLKGFDLEKPHRRDVSLALLSKFRGYSDTLVPTKEGRSVIFGDYRIPVMSNGALFVSPKTMGYPTTILANYGVVSDSISYRRQGRPGTVITLFGPLSLDSFREDVNGKMVLIGWTTAGAATPSSFLMPWYYTMAIRSIMENKFVRKLEFLHILVSSVLLLFAGIISLNIRPFLAMQLLFVLAVGVFLLGYWIFWAYSLLFNLLYPVLATILAMLIFPVVRAWQEAGPYQQSEASTS